MINQELVRIIAERILNGGVNPKTREIYTITDITNLEYKQAVEEYISEHLS